MLGRLHCLVHLHSDWAMWTGWPRLVLQDQQEAGGVASGHGCGCAGGHYSLRARPKFFSQPPLYSKESETCS